MWYNERENNGNLGKYGMKPDSQKKKKIAAGFLPVLIAIVLGAAAGLILKNLPGDAGTVLCDRVLSPISSVILGFLGTLSSFVIFFSIVAGISGMGEPAVFRSVGGRLLSRFFVFVVISSLLCVPVVLLFFRTGGSGSSAFDAGAVWDMLLEIVPTNIPEAFSGGNSVQIIFLALLLGTVLLGISGRAESLIRVTGEVSLLLQTVLGKVILLMPFIVFISVFRLVFTGQTGTLVSVWRYPAAMLTCCFLTALVSVLRVAFRKKVRIGLLLKKMMPAFLIALSTSSSAAALPANMETCEKSLGIDKKLVDIGVPLGQTLFKPGLVFMFMSGCLCLAERNAVPVGISEIVITLLSAFAFSIAAPAVPGCSISCFALLFAQIGIPAEAIAVIIALDPINDRLCAAVKMFAMQSELVCFADAKGMLNEKKLIES